MTTAWLLFNKKVGSGRMVLRIDIRYPQVWSENVALHSPSKIVHIQQSLLITNQYYNANGFSIKNRKIGPQWIAA